MKNKIKKLTFNQFKQLCFQQLHDFVAWSLKVEKLKKIDKAINETEYGKVDVYVEDEDQFSYDDIKTLESEYVYFS